ncbi:MAG: hypothetical protein WA666_12620 [Nitrospirota bacterium]
MKLRKMIAAAALALAVPLSAFAGPPFMTDDPEPVELHHWEVYLASAFSHGGGDTFFTAPHVEVNYGILPETQLHMIVPMAYSSSRGPGAHYGFSDMELGVKYRFLQEGELLPQAGVFPLVELPTGDSRNGLGGGHVRVFIPVWLQKSFGAWTSYGGGGWWYNPGAGNRDYWFGGWLLQRDISKSLTVGAEIFGSTRQAQGEGGSYGFNAGAIINLSEEHHILLSAGRDIHGPNTVAAYAAFQWTFGP